MSRLRIGIICREWPTRPEPSGGIGTYFRNLALGLEQCGAEPVVVTGPTDQPVAMQVRRSFPVVHLDEPGANVVGRAAARVSGAAPSSYRGALFQTISRRRIALQRKLPKLLDRYRVDVMVGPVWAGELAEVARRTSRPLVLRASGCLRRTLRANGNAPDHRDRQIHLLEQQTIDSAAALYAPARRTLRDLLICMTAPHVPISVIPSGVDTECFSPDPNPRTDEPCRFLFVGRLEPQKGLGLLAELIPGLIERVPGAEIYFAGNDTPTAPAGRTWRKHFHVALPTEAYNRCRFLDRVEWQDVPALYRGADVLMVPSVFDSLPNTALEAMSSGLAVVASSGAGLDDVISAGDNGLIIPNDDRRAWLGELIRLAEDSDSRMRLGRRARDTMIARFNLAAAAEPVLNLCRQIVSEQSAGPHAAQRMPAFAGTE